MSNALSNPLALAGRILIALFFVLPGLQKLTGFSGTVAYAASAGMPMPQVSVAIGMLIEIFGGLAMLLGFRTRWAALALAVFTLAATFVFHAFWSAPAGAAMVQQLMFWKNIAISGGLLVLAAHGAGAFSLDGRHRA